MGLGQGAGAGLSLPRRLLPASRPALSSKCSKLVGTSLPCQPVLPPAPNPWPGYPSSSPPPHTHTHPGSYIDLVVAHEMAHLWFGDLVTMADWGELWLNEGFASYFEYAGATAGEPKGGEGRGRDR